MTSIKFDKFGGMLPAWDDTLLPNDQAARALNCYLYSGALQAWRLPKLLRALSNPAKQYAFRIPVFTKAYAHAYFVFIANAINGDTLKVYEETYTFKTTVVNAYDVLIGGSSTATAGNLFAALTGGAGAGSAYGLNTVANPLVSATSSTVGSHDFGSGPLPELYVQAPDYGQAFNTTPVLESTGNARTTWLSDLLSLANTTSHYVGGANETAATGITDPSYWLEFDDPDTTVVRSPVSDDQYGLYYFASPSQQPQYNTFDRIAAGQPPFTLGLIPPGCAPIVTATGGGTASTIGYTTTNGGSNNPGQGYIFLIPIMPDGATQIDDVNLSTNNAAPNAAITGLLYDDNGSGPGTLLNVGGVVTGGLASQTVYVSSFQIPTGLLADTKYWIGFQITGDNTDFMLFDGGSNGVKWAQPGAPDQIAPAVTRGQPDWQIWADVNAGAVLEARSYVYTWLSAYNEESQPSPPTTVTAWNNSVWTVDMFTPPPDDMGVIRNITKKRLYRTVTSSGGVATYYFIAEMDVNQLSYTDTATDDLIVNNNQLGSTLWQPPPEGLQGVYSMPNGMVVGFRGNEIWSCEPFRPHAWPPNYVLTTDFPIIGLGVVGQTVVAATSGYPTIVQGINPSAMSERKVQFSAPCRSRGSILSTEQGVYFESKPGLIYVDPTGNMANATELWISQERWAELTPPKYTRAIRLASCYFAFGSVQNGDDSVAQQGYTIELAGDSQSFSIWPQTGGHRLGFGLLSAPSSFDIVNLMLDIWSATGLTIQNGGVYYYDFTDQAPQLTNYVWTSKLFQQLSKKNYEAFRTFYDIPPNLPPQPPNRAIDPTVLVPGMHGIVWIYADGRLVTSRELRTSGELLRVESGFKTEFWQLVVTGAVRVKNVQFATSVRELGSI